MHGFFALFGFTDSLGRRRLLRLLKDRCPFELVKATEQHWLLFTKERSEKQQHTASSAATFLSYLSPILVSGNVPFNLCQTSHP